MSRKKRDTLPDVAPAPCTYWLTRDSIAGTLSAKCSVWTGLKPVRVRYKNRVVWVDAAGEGSKLAGEYLPAALVSWWRVYPETDREIIRVDTMATAKDQAAWATKHA